MTRIGNRPATTSAPKVSPGAAFIRLVAELEAYGEALRGWAGPSIRRVVNDGVKASPSRSRPSPSQSSIGPP